MNTNRNTRGGCATGTTTPPAKNQAQLGGCPPSQQCQFPTQLQHSRFEGAISEFHGHVYDLAGIHSTNLFTTTTYNF